MARSSSRRAKDPPAPASSPAPAPASSKSPGAEAKAKAALKDSSDANDGVADNSDRALVAGVLEKALPGVDGRFRKELGEKIVGELELLRKTELASAKKIVSWSISGCFRLVNKGVISNDAFEKLVEDDEVLAKIVEGIRNDALEPGNSRRVTDITLGLDTDLSHGLDITNLSDRLLSLFRWHSDKRERTKYMAPYIPIVQSSGMGKTRLLKELKNCSDKTPQTRTQKNLGDDELPKSLSDVHFVMILCKPKGQGSLTPEERKHFNFALTADDINKKLGNILTKVRNPEYDLSTPSIGSPEKAQTLPRPQGQAEVPRTPKKATVTAAPPNAATPPTSSGNTFPLRKRIAFLIDESQHLLDDNDAMAFRLARWWLRVDRKQPWVVAIFAGTTSRLTNYYREKAPSQGDSRSASQYLNYDPISDQGPLDLYPPFFALHTIGCLRNSMDEQARSCRTEFERAAYFGRPLFAQILKGEEHKGEGFFKSVQHDPEGGTTRVVSNGLRAVLQRMLLGVDKNDKWKQRRDVLFSILGTRIQMGPSMSVRVTSTLVASGYANLVSYTPAEHTGSGKEALAQLCFLPDPVCAALAMGVMEPSWSISYDVYDYALTGKDKRFWSQAAGDLFRSGLCIPGKGDVGEVFTALYLLFCGDVLRKKIDASLRTFGVSFQEWFNQVHARPSLSKELEVETSGSVMPCRSPRNQKASMSEGTSNSQVKSMKIGFIQVCRNSYRSDAYILSEEFLESMWNMHVASYLYTYCLAYDMVAPIEVIIQEEAPSEDTVTVTKRYHPMLTSFKNRADVTDEDVRKTIASMKKRLEGMGANRPKAFCLLVYIGLKEKDVPKIGENDEIISSGIGDFPRKDTYRVVFVPSDDPFGITEAMHNSVYAEEAEIYSSHAFSIGQKDPKRLVRCKASDDVEKYAKEVVEAVSNFKKADSEDYPFGGSTVLGNRMRSLPEQPPEQPQEQPPKKKSK